VERKIHAKKKKTAAEELSERAKVWSHAPPGANQESLLDSTIHVASLSTFLLLWLIWMNYPKVLFSLPMHTCTYNKSYLNLSFDFLYFLPYLWGEMIEFDYYIFVNILKLA